MRLKVARTANIQMTQIYYQRNSNYDGIIIKAINCHWENNSNI